MSNPPTPPSLVDKAKADAEAKHKFRVEADHGRLRLVILALRRQVKNTTMLDRLLPCVNPVTSTLDRLPFTPQRVVTEENKTKLLHNHVAQAIWAWGKLARGEVPLIALAGSVNPVYDSMHLDLIERVAATGFKNWGAYPKDRNGAIHVLRTVAEERSIREERAAAQAKSLEAKARRADSLTQEEKDEPDAPSREGAGLRVLESKAGEVLREAGKKVKEGDDQDGAGSEKEGGAA